MKLSAVDAILTMAHQSRDGSEQRRRQTRSPIRRASVLGASMRALESPRRSSLCSRHTLTTRTQRNMSPQGYQQNVRREPLLSRHGNDGLFYSRSPSPSNQPTRHWQRQNSVNASFLTDASQRVLNIYEQLRSYEKRICLLLVSSPG